MAKKQVGVSLRKPPPAADLDSFVLDGAGGAAAASPLAPAILAKKAEVVLAASDGREIREMTIYLDEDLARRLALHCKELDRDVSNVVTEAVTIHLAPAAKKASEPKKLPVPAKRPMRIEIPWEKWQRTLTQLRARLFPLRA